MPDWILLVFSGVLGAMVGSFLNVCILRLPAEESLLFPGSKCPKCEKPIAWYDNIPILSWIVLGGKCRNCKAAISAQYPFIEALTAGIWVAAAWHYGLTPTGVAGALLGTILLGITVTDARHMIIPHEFTFGGLAIGLVIAASQGWGALVTAVIGAATGFGLIWVVGTVGTWALKKEAMGGGDLWMMTMVGAFVGWSGVILTVFLGAMLGTVVFGPIALFKKEQGLKLPFGVFLAAAAAITFVIGGALWAWYVGTLVGSP